MAAFVLLLVVIIAPAHGQITSANNWNSTSNTSWGVPANWTQGSVPNSANTMVQIGTAPRIGTIDLGATNYTIGNLTFHGLNQGSYTLQNGTLNINAATNNTFNAIIQASTNTQTINTALIISNSGTGVPSIRSVASGPLIINGNITFAGNASGEFFPDANAQTTVNGNVNVGANELRFNGAGLLTLAGAVTGTPATRLLGSGVLLLANTNGPVFSNASGQGQLIVQNANGTVRLGANNQIGGFGFNGGTLDLNGFSNISSREVSLYGPNSRVNFSGNGAEALSFGAMNNGATLTVTNFAAGVDTLRIGTGNLSGAQLAQFIFATANGNWTGTGVGGTWQAGRMGSFGLTNAAAQNDGSGYISAVNAYNTAVAFGGMAETVTVSGTVQAGSLSFASGGFALQGGTIQLNGSGVAVTGNNTIGSVIAGTNGLSKTGAGTLTLSGNNSYTGVTTVSDGTLKLGSSTALGNTAGATAVSSGGLLDLNGQTTAETLNYTGTGGLLNSAAGAAIVSGVVDIASGMTVNTTGDITLSGQLRGGTTQNLTKSGAGTLKFTAANSTFAGTNTVSAGTLLVDTGASVAASTSIVNGGLLNVNGTAGAITVNNGGSLGGSGSVGAVTLTNGSHLKPGNSPGTLTAASAIVLGGSTYNWQISALEGTAGTNWDLLSVTGLLNMSGVTSENRWNLVVTADGAFTGWTGTSEYSYVFAQAASVSGFSATVGTDVTSLFNITASGITSLPNSSYNSSGDFKVVVGRGAGGLTTLKLMAIPEPSTGSMLTLGIAGLVVTRLFRRKGV